MRPGLLLIGVMALGASAMAAKDAPAPSVVELDANKPIDAQVEGVPARLQVTTGLVDRLTLHTDFVAANGVKPATIMGSADLNFWGRKEVKGKNRPLAYVISGRTEKARAFWFLNVPQPQYDGSVGPWAIPFDRVTVTITPASGAETDYEFPYFGGLSNGSVSSYQEASFGTAVTFGVERELKYPLASAATGAALAAAYGGTMSGEIWDEPIAFGVTRPVRLMTLERPFVMGPFSFKQIAVRTRSSRDAAGSGETIAEAEDQTNLDPQEIIVEGLGKKAQKPAFTFAIGRAALNQCASITFDKIPRKIRLSCRSN
jgi:hypothetical protein